MKWPTDGLSAQRRVRVRCALSLLAQSSSDEILRRCLSAYSELLSSCLLAHHCLAQAPLETGTVNDTRVRELALDDLRFC